MTICAINLNTDADFEHLVSPSLLGHVPVLLHEYLEDLKRLWLRRRLPTFKDLLSLIFEECWSSCATRITDVVRETSERATTPPQLAWTLTFPSKTDAPDTSLQNDSVSCLLPFQSLDVEFEWISEPPALETFLGFHDWNIYISQPYARRPTIEILRFVDLTAQGSSNGQFVLATTSHHPLERLKDDINAAVRTKAIDVSSPNIEDVIYGYVVVFIAAVLSFATRSFLQSVARAQELVGDIGAPFAQSGD